MPTLKQGDEAPTFHLRDQNGNGWGLGDFRDHFLVLFFEDNLNPEHLAQTVEAFEKKHEHFRRMNTRVLGVSPHDEDALDRLSADHRLTYNLLADTEMEAAKLFGALDTDLGVPRPTSFLIGPDGAILKVYRDLADPDLLTQGILTDLKEYVREEVV